MPADRRAQLAEAQQALVKSLTTGGTAPPGFDADQFRRTAFSLRSKRMRSVARAWPSLAAALGEDFSPLFSDFARDNALPANASSLTDGRRFGHWLERQGRFPDGARTEALAFDFRYALRGDRAEPRRGIIVRIGRAVAGRWVLAFRLPPWGECWWTLPRLR